MTGATHPHEYRVGRIRTRETITRPEMRALVEAAAEALGYPMRPFYDELAHRIDAHGLGVFVGYQDDDPKALAVVLLPTSVMMLHPQLVAAFNQGSLALRRAVTVRVREWIEGAGYDTAAALNLNRPDAVFARGLRDFGRPERWKTMFLFHLKDN